MLFAQIWCNKLSADHYYGGYFYYTALSEKTYQITLVTYTDNHNHGSDRDSVAFFWGDNTSDIIGRQNNAGEGEKIYIGMKKNIYVGTHTYSKNANYKLYFSDNFRLFDVDNILLGKSGSTNLRFDGVIPVQDSVTFCQNNSPIPLTDPYFYGVKDQALSLNFGYWDQDGDSIVYELGSSLGANGAAAEGYSIPSGVSINAKTGQFTWTSPKKGKYCFAFTVKEFRKGQLLGLSSTDFTLFISEVDFPKLSSGTGGIVSGTSSGEYRFTNPENKQFIFSYNMPLGADSSLGLFKSPFNIMPEFTVQSKSGKSGNTINDTLNINYLGNYLLSGYHPVIWEVKTYFSPDTFLIQQFPLLIAVENDSLWPCTVADISKIYELSPELPSYNISPNLFDNYVWINIGNDYLEATIYVYDTRGRLVKVLENLEQGTVKVDLSGAAPALYFLQVVKNNKVLYTGKMVKR